MKRITIAVMMLLFTGISLSAQTNEKQKQQSNKSQSNQNQTQQSTDTQGATQGDNSTNDNGLNTGVLGDDNEKGDVDGNNQNDRNGSSNYRDNEVSGNPNNRSVNEGSNRRTSPADVTGESSTGVPNKTAEADTTAAGTSINNSGAGTSGGLTGANQEESNVPAVIQHDSNPSGSPAVLSEEKGAQRDGTNNVQRADPNMAGAKVKGMKTGKNVDENQEIRKGTTQQQQQNVNTAAEGQVNEGSEDGSAGNQQSQPASNPDDKRINNQATPAQNPAQNNPPRRTTGAKVPTKSNAENTNERDVNNQVQEDAANEQIPAMDTGPQQLGTPSTSPSSVDEKKSRKEKRKERRERRRNRD